MSRYCPHTDGEVLYPACQECEERICEGYFFCLVAGSRGFNDYSFVKDKLDYMLSRKANVVIVSGGARGVDTLAKRYAEEKGYPYKEFPAEWGLLGRSAGMIRNEEMHRYISNQSDRGCVLFWDGKSPGTKSNIRLAEKYGNNIKICRVIID